MADKELFGISEQLDTISRQAAIDALDVLCQEHRYKIPGKRETYSQYNEAWQDALDRAEGAIFNLPTVQPDHNADVSKKAEGDCISRQAALDALGERPMPWTDDDDYVIGERNQYDSDRLAIETVPSAQPDLSEAYSKAVFTWLMDYQIRTAELKGRYTPYEVLSWVINDWRKENG